MRKKGMAFFLLKYGDPVLHNFLFKISSTTIIYGLT